MAENFFFLVADWTLVKTHVLDHPEKRHVDPFEHADSALDVKQGDILRRRHHNAPVQGHFLRQSEGDITCAGRQVHH